MNVLRRMFSRRKLYDDLSDEIRSHLEERTEELIASGMTEEDAVAQARREFGNVLRTEERGREVWQWAAIESFFADVRFGLRMLRKSPGFTIVAVLTLALGIGANTAIFSVVKSVLLRELPVGHPEQLVLLTDPDFHGMETGFGDGDRDVLTYPEFQHLERSNTVFSGLLAVSSATSRLPVEISTPGEVREPVPLNVSLVSGSYFSILDVAPVVGHAFGREVDRVRDANPVAVVSYRFWQNQFAGASSILGRIVRIHETSFDIIGVMPRQFRGETIGVAPDVWVPLSMQSEVFPGRDYLSLEMKPFHKTEWLECIGRLKPGISLNQAKVSINVTFQQLLESQTAGMSAQDKKQFLNQHLAVTEGSHGASILRANFAKPLRVLMATVGLILLIACANIANILLSRSAARQREITVRIAMGAGAGRLFRQVLTESVLLGLLGGAAGLVLSHWADIALLQMVSSRDAQVPLDVQPDASILIFTLGLSVLTGILFGLAPALRATHVDLDSVLRGMRTVTGSHGVPLGKSLVVMQVAVSLLLLIMAGLFVRSFQRLAEVELGYDRDHVLTFSISPLSYGYKGPAIKELYTAMLERLEAIPGVRGASLIDNGLFAGSDSNSPVRVEGEKPKTGDDADSRWDLVGPNFFRAAGIPILYGRDITAQDAGSGQRVGVVNEEFVRHFLVGRNPIGKRVHVMTTEGDADFVIVGVAVTAKQRGVRERPLRRFYIPFFNPIGDASYSWLIVRAAGDPAQAESAVRSAVTQTAANLPPPEIQTMKEVVGGTLATDRMITQLSTAFGGLAVVLACIGLYGVMAYAVSGRINEIGIRIALGAQRSRLLWLILRESLLLVVIGVLIGLPAVFAAGKWVSSLLFGVAPADPAAIATSLVLMFLVGAIACYVPARRAMRVDPMVALKYE